MVFLFDPRIALTTSNRNCTMQAPSNERTILPRVSSPAQDLGSQRLSTDPSKANSIHESGNAAIDRSTKGNRRRRKTSPVATAQQDDHPRTSYRTTPFERNVKPPETAADNMDLSTEVTKLYEIIEHERTENRRLRDGLRDVRLASSGTRDILSFTRVHMPVTCEGFGPESQGLDWALRLFPEIVPDPSKIF